MSDNPAMLFPTPTRAAFAGWHRRNGSWHKLTEQPSEKECWRVLLEVISEMPGLGGDSCVLPAGQAPCRRKG